MNATTKNILLSLLACLVLIGALFVSSAFTNKSTEMTDWKIFTDGVGGVSFTYPESLPTTYIHAIDWPPQVVIESDTFTCIEAGEETDSAGRTEKRIIGTREYCITRESEGAARSVYTLHAYATKFENDTVILTFGTQAVQCGNYDDPEQAACEEEQASFDLDALVNQMVKTLTIKN